MKLVQQVTVEFLKTFSPNHSLVSLFGVFGFVSVKKILV